MAAPTVLVFDDESLVSQNLCKFVIEKANKSIETKQKFIVGVSGEN